MCIFRFIGSSAQLPIAMSCAPTTPSAAAAPFRRNLKVGDEIDEGKMDPVYPDSTISFASFSASSPRPHDRIAGTKPTNVGERR